MTRFFRRGWAEGLIPFALLVSVSLLLAQTSDPEDWANSPEAYFLTKEERLEWSKLDSRDSRAAFKERYWLKRDPTPGTARNEFQEVVLSRIKTADARFSIENTPGSRTARGLVFIVLGSPARFLDEPAQRPPASGPRVLGQRTPVALVEGNETTSTWFYDKDRTPRILEVIERPDFQVKIVLEPSRRSDAIQDPGLFNEVREIVAKKSIVNPDLIPPSGGSQPRTGEPLPREPLLPPVRRVLEEAPAVARRGGAFVGSAVVLRETGAAETLLWVFSPPPSRRPLFHALVRAEDGREVVSISEPAETSSAFSTHAPGLVAVRRLALPAGFYSAAVALTEEGGKTLAAAVLPLQVPAVEKSFAVSSLFLTRAPAPAGEGAERLFAFGGALLPPRADAVFTTSESAWYFFELANPADPARIMVEPRLRRGVEPVAELPAFAARPQPLGPDRYIVGIEVPLATLAPGDYVLYVTVADGNGPDRPRVLRRADFQLVR